LTLRQRHSSTIYIFTDLTVNFPTNFPNFAQFYVVFRLCGVKYSLHQVHPTEALMRNTPFPLYTPEGRTASRVSHAHHEATQIHDDHAVTTLIIENRRTEAQEETHDHDHGLDHSHDWANQAA
jgi:hypothetical protein